MTCCNITSLEGLSGFKRYAVAFLLGALTVLAMPPLGLFPILFLTVPAFATLARFAPTRGKSFCVGWAFGAGYFIFGLYWVSAALFVDIEQWKWVLRCRWSWGRQCWRCFTVLFPLSRAAAATMKPPMLSPSPPLGALWSMDAGIC